MLTSSNDTSARVARAEFRTYARDCSDTAICLAFDVA